MLRLKSATKTQNNARSFPKLNGTSISFVMDSLAWSCSLCVCHKRGFFALLSGGFFFEAHQPLPVIISIRFKKQKQQHQAGGGSGDFPGDGWFSLFRPYSPHHLPRIQLTKQTGAVHVKGTTRALCCSCRPSSRWEIKIENTPVVVVCLVRDPFRTAVCVVTGLLFRLLMPAVLPEIFAPPRMA